MSHMWGCQSRESGQMVELNGKLYFYGGVGNQLINTMSEFNQDTYKWNHYQDNQDNGRYGHIMFKYKNQIIIFGGECNFNHTIKQRECLSDMRIFDIISKQFTKARCSGEIPEPTSNCAYFLIDKYVGIFGGINSKSMYLNSIFIMDLQTFKWEQINYKVDIQEYANTLYNSGIAFHQMVAVFKFNYKKQIDIMEEGIYTFGGRGRDQEYNYDMMIMKRQDHDFIFIKPETQGMKPEPRFHHSMVYNQQLNVLIIYGGKSQNKAQTYQLFYDHLNVLYLKNMTYLRVINKGKSLLVPKAAHSMVSYDSQIIIFGGYNVNGLIPNHIQVIQINQKKVFQYNKLNSIQQTSQEQIQIKLNKQISQVYDPMEETNLFQNKISTILATNKFKNKLLNVVENNISDDLRQKIKLKKEIMELQEQKEKEQLEQEVVKIKDVSSFESLRQKIQQDTKIFMN